MAAVFAILGGALGLGEPGTAPATAHVVYGRGSLAKLVGSAGLVVRARIEETSGFVETGAGRRRPVVSAAVLEVFKGKAEESRVHFAQHGHGVAAFEPGEEVLLFLLPIDQSRELGALAGRGGLAWVSLQEHDAKFVVEERSRSEVVAAVRDYAALAGVFDAEARLAAWRALTLRLLRSKDRRLSASAMGDLVRQGDELVTAESLGDLEPLIDDARVAIGVRLGVLAELERLRLLDAPPRWARLLRIVELPDLVAVVRAVGAHPSPTVNRELIRLLGADEAGVAQAAAMSLGVPGNREAVEPLAGVVGRGEAKSRMAAIRGLGRIATTEAIAVLVDVSRNHADESTRRRAEAELRRLAGARGG